MYLEGSLIVNLFSKIIVTNLPLGPLSSPAMDSWQTYTTRHNACGAGIKFNKEAFGHSHNIRATIVLIGNFRGLVFAFVLVFQYHHQRFILLNCYF